MWLENRNKLLLGGFFLMLVLSYQFALKKTLVLRKEYTSNLKKQKEAVNVPKELSALLRKEKILNSQLAKLHVGGSSMQNDLLKFLNEHCRNNEVKIIEFKSPHSFEGPNIQSRTYIFKLQGGFNGILKTVYEIENKGSFGIVSHVALEKKKEYRGGQKTLEALIFLEHLE